MKRCPTCQRTYDDTQTFCIEDGAVLIADYSTGQYGGSTGEVRREPPPTIYAPPGSLFPQGDYVAPESGMSREPSDPNRPYTPPPASGGYTPGNWQDTPSNPGGYAPTNPIGGYAPPASQPQSYAPPPVSGGYAPPVPQGYAPPPVPNYPTPGVTGTQTGDQSMALISLVCGVLSITCFGLLAGIPAIITGKIARDRIAQDPARYTGGGLAMAGMILGGISTGLSLLWLLFVIIGAVSGSR